MRRVLISSWPPPGLQVIFKEFKYNKETGDLVVDTSPINWKDGCNLTLKVPPPTLPESRALALVAPPTLPPQSSAYLCPCLPFGPGAADAEPVLPRCRQGVKDEKSKGKRDAAEENDVQSFFCWRAPIPLRSMLLLPCRSPSPAFNRPLSDKCRSSAVCRRADSFDLRDSTSPPR
jgi:hypothetical protein